MGLFNISDDPKDPKNYKDRKQPIRTESGAYLDPVMEERMARREAMSDNFADFGTNLLTWGTQLRPATQQELDLGRGSWGDRFNLVGRNVTNLMIESLGAGAVIETAKAASPVIKNIVKNIDLSKMRTGKKPVVASMAADLSKEEMEELATKYDYKKMTKQMILRERDNRLIGDFNRGFQDMESMTGDAYAKNWFSDPHVVQQLEDAQPGLSKDIAESGRKLNTRYIRNEHFDDEILGQYHGDVFSVDLESGVKKYRYSVMRESLFGDPRARTVSLHEGTHFILDFEKNISEKHMNIIKREMRGRNDILDETMDLIDRKNGRIDGELFDYLVKPGEVYPRIMQAREAAGVKPGELFTLDHYDKAIEKLGEMSSSAFGIKSYETMMKKGKHSFIKLANTLPMVGGGVVAGKNIGVIENKNEE